MGFTMQVFGTGLVCSLCMCMGIMFAWPSSTLRLFESANTTLHRPMTESELAMFGSLSSVGALVSTPVAGVFLDRLGRKNSSILGNLLGLLAWTLPAFSNRVEVILLSVFVSGLGGAVFLVVPVYVSEICQESIRGAMTSGTMIFYGLGMLLSYLMGGLLPYYTMVYTCLTLSAVLTVALFLLKESPTCLMIKGLEEEAAKSIAFYRSLEPSSKEVLQEIDVIRRSLNPEMDETPVQEKQNNLKSAAQTNEKLSTLQFIKKSRSTRRALVLIIILVTGGIFQGLVVVQVYAEPLFVESISCLSPTTGSTLLAVVAIVAGLVAAYMTEALGRRPLMIYSSLATAAFCFLLGFQLQFKFGPNWLVAVNLYLYTTFFSFGAGTVPYVLTPELALPEVRSFISMLAVEFAWLCNWILLFIFNPILKAIGLGPVFYIFGVVAVLNSVFSYFMQPETKGLAVDEIQDRLVKKKSKNSDLF